MLQDDQAGLYRRRAKEAMEAAEKATDDAERSARLGDADLWTRMAEYEEKNPGNG